MPPMKSVHVGVSLNGTEMLHCMYKVATHLALPASAFFLI